MEPELTGAARRRARTEGTTVHGVLVAAVAGAASALPGALEDAITVGSAVNARTVVGAGEDIALLSAGGSPMLAGFEGEQEIGAATIDGSPGLLYISYLLHTSYRPLFGFLESIEDHLRAACQ